MPGSTASRPRATQGRPSRDAAEGRRPRADERATPRAMTPERRDPRKPMVRDVAARGARIRFVEAGSGPPLVLVHDYLASRVAWDDVLPRLAENFHVIVPDLPGFGESEKPPPSRYRYDFEGFSESLVDLIAALDLGRVSLCGHAMGGAVTLTLAAAYAHIVNKLVLVNPLVYPQRPDALSRIASLPVVGPLVFKQLYGRTLFRSRFPRRYAPGRRRPGVQPRRPPLRALRLPGCSRSGLRHDVFDARYAFAHSERAANHGPGAHRVGAREPGLAGRARTQAGARARWRTVRSVRLRAISARGVFGGVCERGDCVPGEQQGGLSACQRGRARVS